ncbi:unnamed protein product [Lactuca saligna]|uniref:Uncharacterized protein n=1 Tax=Lactuca saligna TaxID=75948 RepID=A0AA36A420_LACSI|nr:unnamed protein product [Lactuca saligna]
MAVLDLFVVALIPVRKSLLITALGLFLAMDHVNILGDAAHHHLNNVVFYVFIPALVGGSLTDTIIASSIVSLTPQHLHGLVIGSCVAGNLGNMLLIMIPAVCEESNSPFGDKQTCSTNRKSVVSLSMVVN